MRELWYGAPRSSVELSISREVHGVSYEGRTARDAYLGLTRRPGAEDALD